METLSHPQVTGYVADDKRYNPHYRYIADTLFHSHVPQQPKCIINPKTNRQWRTISYAVFEDQSVIFYLKGKAIAHAPILYGPITYTMPFFGHLNYPFNFAQWQKAIDAITSLENGTARGKSENLDK